MADDPPRDLRDAIAEGRALIVCGAGVSQSATNRVAPGWAQLIKDALAEATTRAGGTAQAWAKACELLISSDLVEDWLNAANTIQQKLGGPAGGPYRAFFVGKLGSLKATQPAILEAIAKIAAAKNKIATTNYDHLISQALDWDRADWTDHLRVIEALRGARPAVWHIHGDFDRPNSIIFSQNDYDRIAASELPQFVQRSAGLNFSLVFVGCSGSGLSDDNVGRLLDWMRKGFSGLGDKHFVLTSDDNKDTWPEGVTPVRLGAHADLPSYLAKLAPEPVRPSSLPPDPKMVGRADRLEQLVAAILNQDRPVVVPGALGMGKTTLALAAAYDARVIERFGEGRRFFVNLEPAPDADGVLRRLATDLGLAASGAAPEVEAKIAAVCAAAPALAILDNLETPWRKDTAPTEALLGRLGATKGLRLILTIRGEPPNIPGPGAETLQDVDRLSEAEARALFLRRAGKQFAADPALPALLSALDGHPLSIELFAANAAGKKDLNGLAADWNDRRADTLQLGAADDRKTSLSVSLRLSLDALKSASPAHRLIRVMALLPDGMSEAMSRTILSDAEPTRDQRSAAAKLESARLAARPDGRWRLLTPIRETLLADFSPETGDLTRLIRLFLALAAKGGNAGTDGWSKTRDEVVAEAGNLDAVIGVSLRQTSLPDGLKGAVSGLTKFHRFTGLASTESLLIAATRFRKARDALGEANCLQSLGDIALDRSDHEGGRRPFEAARKLFQKVGDVPGEADCIRGLGDIALARSDYEGARRRFEAARKLFQKVGDVPGEAHCLKGLGNIALARSDHKAARQRYEAALQLYQKVSNVLGEANCFARLGDIALERSDDEGAQQRYEAALPLYKKVGDVLGEADCIKGFGDVALARSDHGGARLRYDAALLLYRQVGAVEGEADCIRGLGDLEEAQHNIAAARDRWRDALALYAKTPDRKSIGLTDIRLARCAATPEEATGHREAARKAWESIDRPDLIEQYLGKSA
jgi:tetratricopeptide (TPR) repeat protein